MFESCRAHFCMVSLPGMRAQPGRAERRRQGAVRTEARVEFTAAGVTREGEVAVAAAPDDDFAVRLNRERMRGGSVAEPRPDLAAVSERLIQAAVDLVAADAEGPRSVELARDDDLPVGLECNRRLPEHGEVRHDRSIAAEVRVERPIRQEPGETELRAVPGDAR